MSELRKLQRPPGYELFFAPLAVVFDPNTLERVNCAYVNSKYGHAKQLRDDGSRYFDHPKGTAWIYINELNGRDPDTIIDMLLHDIQEDTYLLSTYRISLNFGVEIALDERALTKLPKGKETIEEYLQRVINRGPRVILTKLCDRLHNLRSMAGCTQEKRAMQIAETREYHLPMLILTLQECGGEWVYYADALEKKINKAIALYE